MKGAGDEEASCEVTGGYEERERGIDEGRERGCGGERKGKGEKGVAKQAKEKGEE